MMLTWLIINTIVLIPALVALVYVTIQWLRAEKKLAKFGQSLLYKRMKNSRLYKKCENFFKNDVDKQQ